MNRASTANLRKASEEDNDSISALLDEQLALIKALAPKEAPNGLSNIKGVTGLNIMKNDLLPENTVMVSKRLFDLIYEIAQPYT